MSWRQLSCCLFLLSFLCTCCSFSPSFLSKHWSSSCYCQTSQVIDKFHFFPLKTSLLNSPFSQSNTTDCFLNQLYHSFLEICLHPYPGDTFFCFRLPISWIVCFSHNVPQTGAFLSQSPPTVMSYFFLVAGDVSWKRTSKLWMLPLQTQKSTLLCSPYLAL